MLVKTIKSDQRGHLSSLLFLLSMQVKWFMGNNCLYIFWTKCLMLMHCTGHVFLSLSVYDYINEYCIQTQISMHCGHTV